MLILYAKQPSGVVLAAERHPDNLSGEQLRTVMEDFAIMMDDCRECDLAYRFIDDGTEDADDIISAEHFAMRQVIQELEDRRQTRDCQEDRRWGQAIRMQAQEDRKRERADRWNQA